MPDACLMTGPCTRWRAPAPPADAFLQCSVCLCKNLGPEERAFRGTAALSRTSRVASVDPTARGTTAPHRATMRVPSKGIGPMACRGMSSIAQIRASILDQSVPAVQVTRLYLDRIQQAQDLGAYIAVDREGALREAEAIDRSVRAGQAPAGSLLGAPLAVKDNICVRGLKVWGEGLLTPEDSGRNAFKSGW